MSKSITLKYFAVFREQSGQSAEEVSTDAETLADLYTEVQQRYGFRLPHNVVRVAVANEFRNWTDKLNENDSVVFIPPVAGG